MPSLAILALGLGIRALGADSITFKETFSDRLVRDGSGVSLTVGFSRSFSAAVTFPELACVSLRSNTLCGFSVGDIGYSFALGAADDFSNCQFAFILRDEEGRKIGRMILGWTNSTLIITGGVTRLGGSLISGRFRSRAGRFEGRACLQLSLGDFVVERTLYFKGRTSIAQRRVGEDLMGEDVIVSLSTVTLSGTSDDTPPVVSVLSHRSGQRLLTNAIEVSGVARDDFGSVLVFASHNGVELSPISPFDTGGWYFPLELVPGTNVFSVWAGDDSGNISVTNTVTLFRVVKVPLRLSWDDGGRVNGLTNGQLLELGRSYRVTARPAVTNRFGGWNGGGDSGSVHSPEAALSFVMQPGMALHASFSPPVLAPLTLEVTAGNSVLGVTNGVLLEVGRIYQAVAKPGTGNVFLNWAGSVPSSHAALRFTMESNSVLQANFTTNPWLSVTGNYTGLVIEADTETLPMKSGSFVLTLTANGRITGRLRLLDGKFPFSGRAGLDGTANILVPRPDCLEPLMLSLGFDVENVYDGTLVGEVSSPSGAGSLSGVRPARDAAYAGRYTFRIGSGETGPAGEGAGTIVIDGQGKATLAGSLGDGTPFSLSTMVSRSGRAPLSAPLYGGRGFVQGWFNFNTNGPPVDLGGSDLTFVWFKPRVGADRYFPEGFVTQRSFVAVRYAPPPPGANALPWTNGILGLGGGNLPDYYERSIRIIDNVVAVTDDTIRVAVKLTPRTGHFTMSFVHPLTGKTVTGKGALLQFDPPFRGFEFWVHGVGAGWFRGINESGYIHLLPLLPEAGQ